MFDKLGRGKFGQKEEFEEWMNKQQLDLLWINFDCQQQQQWRINKESVYLEGSAKQSSFGTGEGGLMKI